MAGFNRRRDSVSTTGHSQLLISGQWSCNGAGAITNQVGGGTGWTAARTGVGVYAVTLTQPLAAPYSVTPALVGTVQGTFSYPQVTSLTSGGFVLQNSVAAGTATDIAAGTGIMFKLTGAISSLTR